MTWLNIEERPQNSTALLLDTRELTETSEFREYQEYFLTYETFHLLFTLLATKAIPIRQQALRYSHRGWGGSQLAVHWKSIPSFPYYCGSLSVIFYRHQKFINTEKSHCTSI